MNQCVSETTLHTETLQPCEGESQHKEKAAFITLRILMTNFP